MQKKSKELLEQVQKFNLPQDPAKEKDPNCRRFIQQFGHGVTELDALPPNILSEMVEASIQSVIDWNTWNETASIEKEEIERVKQWQ